MAEGKTVNVKIQYNVDSSQVQKSEQLLKQAQAAANAFQQSAQKSGQATTNSFNQANRSILSMEQELARLKTQISVTSNPAAVKRLSDQYKQLAVQLREATKQAYELPKAIKESESATKSLTSQFGQFVGAVRLFLTAGLVREALNLTLQMATLSGKVEGVERAFNRLPESTRLIDNLRKSTHGTVGDLELMQKALMSQSYKIPLQSLGKLLEFAAVRAQQTGQEVNHLVDYIVTGIGLRSVRRLDDLGFTAARLKEALGGVTVQAASMGQVVNAVTKLMDEDLNRFGGYVETSETKVKQLNTAWEELKISVAQKLTSSGAVDFLKESVEGLNALVKTFSFLPDDQIAEMKQLAAQTAANESALKRFDTLQKQFNDSQEENIILAKKQVVANVERINTYDKEIKKLDQFVANADKLDPLGVIPSIQKQRDLYFQQSEAMKFRNVELAAYNKLLAEYLISEQNSNVVTEESIGLIESLQEKIEGLKESVVKAGTVEEIERLNVELVKTEFELRELQELGKTPINPLASLVFDLKNFPKLKLKDALPTSDEIAKDTKDLGKELANKMKDAMGPVGTAAAEGFVDHFKIALEGMQEDILLTGIDIFSEQLLSFETAELASLQNRLNNLRNFYDEQQILAGDNERLKDVLRLREEKESAALQKRIAEQERRARRFSIIIDTAAGIARAFATSTTIYEGIINAALVAARGASQLAIVNRTPARFAKGGLNIQGPGTGTSDSIPAQISKGESVMTASEWRTSKNVLKEVRAKTLDDKVLQDLKLTREGVRYVGMDDKNIVKEIRELKNSMPDVEERAGLLYKTKRKSDNFKQWVRLSSMSK